MLKKSISVAAVLSFGALSPTSCWASQWAGTFVFGLAFSPLCGSSMGPIYASADMKMWRNLNFAVSLRSNQTAWGGFVEELTVHGKCVQGVWPKWRWQGKHSWEPAWRTWTLPRKQHDLKMKKIVDQQGWLRTTHSALQLALMLQWGWLYYVSLYKVVSAPSSLQRQVYGKA